MVTTPHRHEYKVKVKDILAGATIDQMRQCNEGGAHPTTIVKVGRGDDTEKLAERSKTVPSPEMAARCGPEAYVLKYYHRIPAKMTFTSTPDSPVQFDMKVYVRSKYDTRGHVKLTLKNEDGSTMTTVRVHSVPGDEACKSVNKLSRSLEAAGVTGPEIKGIMLDALSRAKGQLEKRKIDAMDGEPRTYTGRGIRVNYRLEQADVAAIAATIDRSIAAVNSITEAVTGADVNIRKVTANVRVLVKKPL